MICQNLGKIYAEFEGTLAIKILSMNRKEIIIKPANKFGFLLLDYI